MSNDQLKNLKLSHLFVLVSREPKAIIERRPDGTCDVIADRATYDSPFGKSSSRLTVVSGVEFYQASIVMKQYNDRLDL